MNIECSRCGTKTDDKELSSCLGFIATEMNPMPKNVDFTSACDYPDDKYFCPDCIDKFGFCKDCQEAIPLTLRTEIFTNYK